MKAAAGPLNCLFAINKPTGILSMTLLNQLQPLLASSTLFKDPSANKDKGGKKGKYGKKSRFNQDERVKLGQGGTLDPLADGVLVVGTNGGTKHLQKFLECTKEYVAIGLFGCSTDSYDTDGKVVNKDVNWDGENPVTAERIEEALKALRGEIMQVPPVYSALKMDGKALHEYARTNTPLPRPIPPRKVTVHELELHYLKDGTEHSYEYPKEELNEEEKIELVKLMRMVKEGAVTMPEVPKEEALSAPVPTETKRPPIFEIRMTVSSGTYVRSIVHDIGVALGTSAHVVKLTRTRQGEFALNPERIPVVAEKEEKAEQSSDEAVKSEVVAEASGSGEAVEGAAVEGEAPKVEEEKNEETVIPKVFSRGCVEWSLLAKAIQELEERKKNGGEATRDAEGMMEWEQEILSRCQMV
ncbi:tRNA pseudouridine synthase B [Pseudohyphozyma bogoriensis]|nr:tRNA pseudouridine synthase B [Pseudohyphozyma bogoriensis]